MATTQQRKPARRMTLTHLPGLLQRANAKQVELAGEIDVTVETVSRWVNGHSDNPSSAHLLAILAFLQRRDPSITFQDVIGRAA